MLLDMNGYFNKIDWLQFLYYNIYGSTLFYTNVSISTPLWVCDPNH